MNINVSVTVFAAPGLSIGRQQAVTSIANLFRSKTFPVINLNTGVPLNTLNIVNVITSMNNVPLDIVQNLLFLRMIVNGRELNMFQSLTENGITNNHLINLHLIAK
jgi:hypothetical protein